jgi:hypothetical protein
VFKSTDEGANWSLVLATTFVRALAIDPSIPVTLFAGTAVEGVFKSTDGGANWSAANAGLSNRDVRALAIDPSTTPATLYAGTFGGGVFEYENTSEGSDRVNFLGGDSGCFIGTLAYESRMAE